MTGALSPDQVPSELVDDAVDAWHEMPRPLLLDDQMRYILAAVLPAYEKHLQAERDAQRQRAETAEAEARNGTGQKGAGR